MEEICLSCFLSPYKSFALIYGLDPYSSCDCQNNRCFFRKVLKVVYIQFVEYILWQQLLMNIWEILPGFGENAICIGWFDIANGSPIARIGMACHHFYIATVFSFFKNVKVDLQIGLRNRKYFEQNIKEGNNIVRRACFICSLMALFISFWFQTVAVVYLYPFLNKRGKFPGEALFCCVHGCIAAHLMLGINIYILLLGALSISAAHKEYDQLLQDLSSIRRNELYVESKLEKLMLRHQELWTFVNQLNDKISYPFVMIYAFITSMTCFCYYSFLFINMTETIKYMILGWSIFYTFLCIIYGCLMCSFSFNMLNGFQDIRNFVESDFRLKKKLKILDFMKRFGKVPLSLSMGGFYYINKKFPIKIVTTLHSIFSGLLKLKNISRDAKNQEIFLANVTNPLSNSTIL